MKAIIFDFDGTLTKSKKGSNCWYKVWDYLDDLDYDSKLYGMFERQEITDSEWMDLIFERYVEKGLTDRAMQEISDKIDLLDGVKETFELLKENDVKIYVLSGGIKQIIEKVLKREGVLKYISSFEAYSLNFNKEGDLVSYSSPKHNGEKKSEFVESLIEQLGICSEDILFVGNGKNDEEVYKSGVKTLCINPDGADFENRKVWTYAIEKCSSMCDILQYCNLKDCKKTVSSLCL